MNSRRKDGFFVSLIGVMVLFTSIHPYAHAEVPQAINYQGYLADNMGDPVPEGDYEMVFSIYDEADTLLWSETQKVTVTGGIHNVQIGQDPVGNPFPAGLFEGERYLGIKVGLDAEMAPKQRLTSVPYAIRAQETDTLNGMVSSDFAEFNHDHDFSEITGTASDTQIPDNITINHATSAGNADTVDGNHAADFAAASHSHSFPEITGTATNAQIPDDITINYAKSAAGAANADMLDGMHASAFASSTHAHDTRYYSKEQVDKLVAALQSRITQLENLLMHFSRSDNQIYITGANLHIVNGTGTTDGFVNSLGNLIVGYNELRNSGDVRTGSHNIVVGKRHNYSSYAGLVVGNYNTISGAYASVSGGWSRTADGEYDWAAGNLWEDQ